MTVTMMYPAPKTLWVVSVKYPTNDLRTETVIGETEHYWISERGSKFAKVDGYSRYFFDFKDAIYWRESAVKSEVQDLKQRVKNLVDEHKRVSREAKMSEEDYRKHLREELKKALNG